MCVYVNIYFTDEPLRFHYHVSVVGVVGVENEPNSAMEINKRPLIGQDAQ